jgi:hypothetical protein
MDYRRGAFASANELRMFSRPAMRNAQDATFGTQVNAGN